MRIFNVVEFSLPREGYLLWWLGKAALERLELKPERSHVYLFVHVSHAKSRRQEL